MTSPVAALRQKVHRFADQQSQRIADAAAMPVVFFATITTVTAGGARDGNALVKVTWFGRENRVNGYVNTYTPVVNDRVVCAYDGVQVVVLGKVIGHP